MKKGKQNELLCRDFNAGVIARSKQKGPVTKAKFLKELIKNHTVEDYAAAILFGAAPVTILKDKNAAWYEGCKGTNK